MTYASDDFVTPGITGSGVNNDSYVGVQVYQLVQNVVSGPFTPPQLFMPNLTNYSSDSVWVSMMSEVDWYIIWGTKGNAPPDPLVTATPAANPTQQCIRVPANFEYMRKVGRGENFKLLQVDSGDDTFVRMETVQPHWHGA